MRWIILVDSIIMIRCGTGRGIRTEFIVYIINPTYHTADVPYT